ncbi:MAG: SDR family oxidoreductase [Alphaproteobacteria bacterium]|nr:SDR family oxidoreductase [Alphaproteobacteria bacterium]
MMGVLSGKAVILTGASSGIGKGTALKLAEASARIVFTGRDGPRSDETLATLRAMGAAVELVRLDVTSEADWARVIDTCLSRFGRVDVLINNAGDAVMDRIEKLPANAMNDLIGVNVDGPFLGMRAVWPHMKKQGGGLIINVNSVAGQRGNVNGSAYCGSKAAQLSLSLTAAAEGGKDNIRVVSLHPGFTLTEGLEETLCTQPQMLQPMIDSMIPIKLPGRPADMGDAVVFLCSDDARNLTGIEINVDGGMTAR